MFTLKISYDKMLHAELNCKARHYALGSRTK